MSQEIQLNVKKPDTTLREVLNLIKQEVKLEINCHAIGTIQSFDSSNQTATITINYLRTYYEKIDNSENYKKTTVEYPLLIDCPVVCLRGGSAGLSLPIQKGDECLVLFNDRSIDNWFSSGQVLPVSNPRLHSMSDGIALVGLSNSQRSIEDYDATRASLYYGKTRVAVGEEKVKIENETKNLNTILQNLITVLVGLTTAPPFATSLSPTSIAQLQQVALDLGELLE